MYKVILSVIGALILCLVGWWVIQNGYITIPKAGARMPSLTRTIEFAKETSEERKNSINDSVAIDQDFLKNKPNNLETWLDLAIQYKQAGDIKGAIEVWKYLNETFPHQSTSAFNLGVIYHQDLKKYELSEENYREAIRREPQAPLNYLGLHELYRYAYKQNTDAAALILREGIENIPDDANLYIALAAYYRDDKKNNEAAIENIIKARDILNTLGNTEKAKALDGEIIRLTNEP